MTRRWLIITATIIIFGLILFRWRYVFHQLFFKPGGKPQPPRSTANPFVEDGKARVALVTGAEPGELVRKSLQMLNASERLSLKGKRVLIKPNVVTGSAAPTTTNPEVVRAACEWVRAEGAEKVWVGDMSALMSLGTRYSMRSSGIQRAAEQSGAIPVYFDEHEWAAVELPGANFLKQVHVSKFVLEADVVINVPVMKTHKWATYSVCMKNFVGATHGCYRPYRVDEDHWEEIVAEINLAYQPDLNIVDGTKVMYAGGPWRGDSFDAGMIIAGGDRIACDALAVGFMKTFGRFPKLDRKGVWEQRQIKHAIALGLGIKGPEAIGLSVHHMKEPSEEMRNRLEQMKRYVFGYI